MSSTIQANIAVNPGVTETFDATTLPTIGATSLQYSTFSKRWTLNASSTPPVTKVYAEEVTSDGAETLDFTALVRSIGGTIDATGLKLQALALYNKSTTNTVTIGKGASNGYDFNATAQTIVVQAESYLLLTFNDDLADVSGSVKTIDIVATSGQAYDLMLIFG
jgi:hypothetical protein